ncbi:MAG: phosphate acyltransferase PlsX [Ruminococcaceae bacterium]|nr:phosphate acyltransferase PlsX [Oscillospiraceae bacterium]
MKLIIDAMGGDNAPEAIVKGALKGAEKENISLLFVGDEKRVREIAERENTSVSYEIYDTGDNTITMSDDPMLIMKTKRESSMGRAITLLKEGQGDALISAGSTGALLVGASLILRRIKGVKRAVIAATLPFGDSGVLLLDSGANTLATPVELTQYALMGSLYVRNVMKKDSPKVGLLNNGAEETKGTPDYAEAHRMMKEHSEINFFGNIEGCDIPYAKSDIIVCDGFSGNIALKTLEGFGMYLMKSLKNEIANGGLKTKLGGLLIKDNVYALKKKLDSSEYGGAPILGVGAPMIKAHGSSDEKAIASAVRQAVSYASTGVCTEIGSLFSRMKEEQAQKEE